MPRLILIYLLSCLIIRPVIAQTKKIDSLRAVLAKHPQADTVYVNQLNELADALRFRKRGYDTLRVQQSDSVLNQAFELAKRLKYLNGQARTLENMAWSYMVASNYHVSNPKKSQALLKQALALAQRSRAKELQLDILSDLGAYNVDTANAIRYNLQALALAKRWNMPSRVIDILMGIGYQYDNRSNYTRSLFYFFQAQNQAQRAQDTTQQVRALVRISSIYSSLTDYEQGLQYAQRAQRLRGALALVDQQNVEVNLARSYADLGRYPQAIAIYQKLLKGIDPNSFRLKSFIFNSLADLYQQVGNLPQASHYARQVVAMGKQFRVDVFLRGAYLTLCRTYSQTHQTDSALYYGRQALIIAEQYRDKETTRDASQLLADLHAQLHEYDRAYRYQSRYINLKDSLNNEDVTRKATAMRFTDQMSRQQSQITLLNKDKQLQAEEVRRQRQLLYASLAILALIGGLLAILYHNNFQKKRANALLQRQKQEIQQQQDKTQQSLTELKATQTQLIQKEKMASLGELTAGIAHEIQNPLNFVNNFSEVSIEMIEELKEEAQAGHIEDVLAIADDLSGNLQKINHHGSRASNIVKGMLEHSRTETGEKRPTDLNALADEYLKIAYQGLRAKDKSFECTLVTEYDADLGQVNVVPQEIGRVLLNLYNNAFYAVRERQQHADSSYLPTLTVTTEKTPESVQIRVADNGTGIPESVKQKIFQPFFTTKPTGEGTGLGLSLSYDIITKGHGGALRVESQAGEGTTFVIELPQRQKSDF
ncbi:tetratricopeptide repeat protein [Spirosoma sp. HMF4905]|uniref:histidine kinase n=1 Tax=Spirosoma arboris TaxID=2682092 RepID=A0A7K1SHM0_9BACT|nr:ATP-binding protein [Spirosoma arboris]MVM33265.1 tetratricopeptide repeat protein [Spirosoma arboris]